MQEFSETTSDDETGESAPESSSDETSAEKSDEEILEEALARFKLVEEAESDIRKLSLEDMRFAAGDQWDEEIKNARALQKRPCLTINKLPQQIRQVTNDQRQNRPSIKVHAVDDHADPKTAKVLQGLVRHIEYNSSADSAYDTGFEGAVRGGRGFWRVITAYTDPMSFDQDILIKRVLNPLSVYLDPHLKEPDSSDSAWGFVIESLSKDEFKAAFPKADLSKQSDWESFGNSAPGWMSKDSARVAEYFYRTYKTETIVQLSDGSIVPKKMLPPMLPEGVTVVKERNTQVPTIKWCKISATEILEKTDWPGKYIPIVPVYGEELDLDGERILKGIVRDAKDPQRMLNVWKSAETEVIALTPKAPFIAAKGQIEGFEADWETANTHAHSVLEYNPISINGTPMPPPQRQSFEPAVQAITQAAMLAADDIKGATGIYDASLGNRSNETSGVAIQRRNMQSQTGNFHFVDNLARAQKYTGRIIIDLLPHIYDSARIARTIGEDGEQKLVKLNQPTDELDDEGQPVIHDLSIGKYDVTVDSGPSFASKRQEATAFMQEMVKSYPATMQIAGDLVMKSMDVPGAQELGERFKKTLAPGLADEPKEGEQKIPPQVQAQIEQMNQMIDQLTAKTNEQADTIQQKRVEIESKERIEFAKIKSNEVIAMATIDAKDSLALLGAEISATKHRLDLLNIGMPVEDVTMDDQDPAAQGAPQEQPQDFDPQQPDGAYEGAEFGDGGLNPPGGGSPEQPPMEGDFQ